MAAVRHVALNPARARLADSAAAWPWSSALAHPPARDDGRVTVAALLDAIGDGSAFLAVEPRADEMDARRRHERTGRPPSDGTLVATLEAGLG